MRNVLWTYFETVPLFLRIHNALASFSHCPLQPRTTQPFEWTTHLAPHQLHLNAVR